MSMDDAVPFGMKTEVCPGLAKLMEEMGELQQVLGKLLQTGGNLEHWQGNLWGPLVDEMGDVRAALDFFEKYNFTHTAKNAIAQRRIEKLDLFDKWRYGTGG